MLKSVSEQKNELLAQFKERESSFKSIGLKFICERKNKSISTWHCTLNKPIEDIINEIKHSHDWIGGNFVEIYLEFDNEKTKYIKYQLDINAMNFNSLLNS